MDLEPSKFLGIDFKVAPLVASFFGAVAYAVVLKVRNPIQLLSIVLVGLAVSYFLGPLIVDTLQHWGFAEVTDDGLQNASGFISGLAGMAICNGVIAVGSRLGLVKAEKKE